MNQSLWSWLTTIVFPPGTARRAVFFVIVIIGIFGGAAVGAAAWYNSYYEGRVYPGVRVGNYDFGGRTPDEIKQMIEARNDRYAKDGVPITFTSREGQKRLVNVKIIIAGDEAPESIKLGSEAFVNVAISQGRTADAWRNFWAPIIMRVYPRQVTVPVVSDETRLMQTLKASLMMYEDLAHDAILEYNRARQEPKVILEQEGRAFVYSEIITDLEKVLASMSEEPVTATLRLRVPRLKAAAINEALPRFTTIVKLDKMTLTYMDESAKTTKEWVLDEEKLAELSAADLNEIGQIIFILDREKTTKYITDEISPAISVEPLEAKFSIADGQVQEFQASRPGKAVDMEETIGQLAKNFIARNDHILNDAPIFVTNTTAIVVKVIEPTMKTADVNDLGITDIIGVGISTFRDSKTNRIKNIAHAAKKLNGLLIKPGEEFSANKSAGPYTAENGYLPEAVIKGREIKPEIGGGMCQIGTTLFRMAMNSGLPITERHNHSLVVSYYADPVNRNPGTDATLYEPILDFKFKNETGNYLLLQTEVNYIKQELRFSLWGTPDGRSGSYTHPLVKRWIASGEPETTYVDDGSLAPGRTKCQSAFPGAVASFTYTRTTTAGEKIEQVFDSYYRPLPKICLVGVEPGTLCEGKPCDQLPTEPVAAF